VVSIYIYVKFTPSLKLRLYKVAPCGWLYAPTISAGQEPLSPCIQQLQRLSYLVPAY
jgi:hypothetical protein